MAERKIGGEIKDMRNWTVQEMLDESDRKKHTYETYINDLMFTAHAELGLVRKEYSEDMKFQLPLTTLFHIGQIKTAFEKTYGETLSENDVIIMLVAFARRNLTA